LFFSFFHLFKVYISSETYVALKKSNIDRNH
jgi:hypothetical protein